MQKISWWGKLSCLVHYLHLLNQIWIERWLIQYSILLSASPLGVSGKGGSLLAAWPSVAACLLRGLDAWVTPVWCGQWGSAWAEVLFCTLSLGCSYLEKGQNISVIRGPKFVYANLAFCLHLWGRSKHFGIKGSLPWLPSSCPPQGPGLCSCPCPCDQLCSIAVGWKLYLGVHDNVLHYLLPASSFPSHLGTCCLGAGLDLLPVGSSVLVTAVTAAVKLASLTVLAALGVPWTSVCWILLVNMKGFWAWLMEGPARISGR